MTRDPKSRAPTNYAIRAYHWGGSRTHTPFGTSSLSLRDYQFQHPVLYGGRVSNPRAITAEDFKSSMYTISITPAYKLPPTYFLWNVKLFQSKQIVHLLEFHNPQPGLTQHLSLQLFWVLHLSSL